MASVLPFHRRNWFLIERQFHQPARGLRARFEPMFEPEIIQALQQRPVEPHVYHLVFVTRFHIRSIRYTFDMILWHYVINAVSLCISPDPPLPNRNLVNYYDALLFAFS